MAHRARHLSEVVEGQRVDEVAEGIGELRVRHFELSDPIGETIAQWRLDHPGARGPALKRGLNFPGKAVECLSGIVVETVRLGQLSAQARHVRPERFF